MNRYIASIVVFVTVAFGGMGGEQFVLTLACGAAMALTITLLWRPGEPPILLLPAGIQLAQVVTPTLYANALGLPIQAVSMGLGDVTAATSLALVAMVSL